jgi:hypothetical protein
VIVQDVITRVQRQFGDEASVQVTSDDVIRWINDAQKEIAVQNDLMQATATAPSVAGVNSYTFPSDMLGLNKLFYNNLKLRYLSRQEYDAYVNTQDPNEVANGDPLLYTRWGNQYLVYPKPQSVGTFKLLYTQRPPEVANGADSLSLSLEYHPRIVEFCLRQAYEMDEDWDAAAVKATQFDSGLSILKENEYSKDRETYPTITVLPEDSGLYYG